MIATGPVPAPVSCVLDFLGVPPEDRDFPVERVLETGHLIEIRVNDGRYYICGQIHEFPILADDPVLESLLEESFNPSALGFLAYETATERVLYWSEILAGPYGKPPVPHIPSFLRELTEISKKVSLAGRL